MYMYIVMKFVMRATESEMQLDKYCSGTMYAVDIKIIAIYWSAYM